MGKHGVKLGNGGITPHAVIICLRNTGCRGSDLTFQMPDDSVKGLKYGCSSYIFNTSFVLYFVDLGLLNLQQFYI